MLKLFAIWVAKAIATASRLGGSSATAAPGLIAEKLAPNLIGDLAAKLKHGSIVITGTNGKTSTAKMVAMILQSAGYSVVANRSGSNLSRGIASALAAESSLLGHISADWGVFEVDEAAMPEVARQLQPKLIAVLNLHRDQLDRFGELDKTAGLIGRGIAATKAEVWLNADDPLVADLAKYAQKGFEHFFGIASSPYKKLSHDHTADSAHCPRCGYALDYSQNWYGHIGHYKCLNDGYARPEPEVQINKFTAQTSDRQSFVVSTPLGKAELTIPQPGLYSAYNALAAMSIALGVGVNEGRALSALTKSPGAFGRSEEIRYQGRRLVMLLIKNPTGFNQIIQTYLSETPQSKVKSPDTTSDLMPPNLLVAINDKYADGRDVSWLWDVAFDELQRGDMKQLIIASGTRATDLALRLKYAEISAQTTTDLSAGLRALVKATKPGETAYILPTYTAMLNLRKLLAKEVKMAGINQ